MSASTRIVTGLFFAVLASVFLCAGWKRRNFVERRTLYDLPALAYGFYEQVLVFSVTLILLLAF